MKKTIPILLFSLLSALLFSQTDSTYFGKWKITVVAGEKRTVPSYLLLKSDSTFMTGSDSTFSDQKQKASEGKWKVTSQEEIELIPSDTSREIHYYKHVSGWKFKYASTEKKGVKSPVFMLEMDIYVEKLVATPSGKKKKKGKG
jgi:hypothetical protein